MKWLVGVELGVCATGATVLRGAGFAAGFGAAGFEGRGFGFGAGAGAGSGSGVGVGVVVGAGSGSSHWAAG